jgi:hypothetical protein
MLWKKSFVSLLVATVVCGVLVGFFDGEAVAVSLQQLDQITGGADPKFSCVDACATAQGNTHGSCTTQVSSGGIIVTCGTPPYVGVICGEVRQGQQVRNQCQVDPAGAKDPCVNGIAAAHCYQYQWCACTASKCAVGAKNNPWTNFGSVVSSNDCP